MTTVGGHGNKRVIPLSGSQEQALNPVPMEESSLCDSWKIKNLPRESES